MAQVVAHRFVFYWTFICSFRHIGVSPFGVTKNMLPGLARPAVFAKGNTCAAVLWLGIDRMESFRPLHLALNKKICRANWPARPKPNNYESVVKYLRFYKVVASSAVRQNMTQDNDAG